MKPLPRVSLTKRNAKVLNWGNLASYIRTLGTRADQHDKGNHEDRCDPKAFHVSGKALLHGETYDYLTNGHMALFQKQLVDTGQGAHREHSEGFAQCLGEPDAKPHYGTSLDLGRLEDAYNEAARHLRFTVPYGLVSQEPWICLNRRWLPRDSAVNMPADRPFDIRYLVLAARWLQPPRPVQEVYCYLERPGDPHVMRCGNRLAILMPIH